MLGCSPCYVACGFAMASVATAFFNTAEKKAFKDTLTAEQILLYGGIVRRRALIYAGSMFAGALVAYAALAYMRANGHAVCSAVCVSVAVMMGAAYVAYVLWPKGAFMLEYLNTAEQVAAWLRMYKRMSLIYHGGFLLGVVAYALVAWNYMKRGK